MPSAARTTTNENWKRLKEKWAASENCSGMDLAWSWEKK
jgi:hypothetical protein